VILCDFMSSFTYDNAGGVDNGRGFGGTGGGRRRCGDFSALGVCWLSFDLRSITGFGSSFFVDINVDFSKF
jgi:hypothetical protein